MFAAKLEELLAKLELNDLDEDEMGEFLVPNSAAILALVRAAEAVESDIGFGSHDALRQALATLNGANDEL
jgi:hypothetical protein